MAGQIVQVTPVALYVFAERIKLLVCHIVPIGSSLHVHISLVCTGYYTAYGKRLL
jgi:hypothetical protein